MESFPVALNIKLTNLPLLRRTRQGEVLLLLGDFEKEDLIN